MLTYIRTDTLLLQLCHDYSLVKLAKKALLSYTRFVYIVHDRCVPSVVVATLQATNYFTRGKEKAELQKRYSIERNTLWLTKATQKKLLKNDSNNV